MLQSPECPNCRRGIPRMRVFWSSAWSRWRCPGCGALLGVNTRRRLLAMIPWFGIVIVLLFVLKVANWGLLVAIPLIVGLAMANFFVFDRVRVFEWTEVHCGGCGYDLRGQQVGRCPECGAPCERFGAEAAAAAAVRRPDDDLRRRRLMIICIFTALFIVVLTGMITSRMMRARIAATPGAPAGPAAPATPSAPAPSGVDDAP